MFIEIANGLTEHSASVRSFEACAREARARIAGEPEQAIAWLLVARAAQAFVDAYDDQPLTLDIAGKELERFRQVLETLESAYAGGSAEAKVAALNTVALRLSAV